MDTHELAWSAGFFDGEGHVGFSRGKRHDIYLRISQVDRGVLDRFRAAVGVGAVSGPHERHIRRPRERDVYYYQLQRFEYLQAVIAMIWKFLSPVKRLQASAAIRKFRAVPVGKRLAKYWLTCKRGHPRTPENVKIVMFKGYECRRCLACLRARPVTEKLRARWRAENKRRRQRKLAAALIIAT